MMKRQFSLLTGILLSFVPLVSLAQNQGVEGGSKKGGSQGKVIYQYKSHEKFDFSELGVGANDPFDNSLSIDSRPQGQFDNKLPNKENFNDEIKLSVENFR